MSLEAPDAALPDFAMVPRSILRCGDRLTDGAVMHVSTIFGFLPFHSDPEAEAEDRQFRTPRGGWSLAMRHTERAVRRWRNELKRKGYIIEGDRFAWMIGPQAPCEGSPRVRLPLLLDRGLTPDLWRTWAVLYSYRDKDGNAYPALATLAEDMGLSRRTTVTDRIQRLADMGLVAVKRRRRGSNVYEVPPKEARSQTVNQGGPKPSITRTQTGNQGGPKPVIKADPNRQRVRVIEVEPLGRASRRSLQIERVASPRTRTPFRRGMAEGPWLHHGHAP